MLQRFDQGLGTGGDLQTSATTHQQRVRKQFTQLRQCMTNRRLTAVQAQRGTRYVLLDQQCMQSEQQIQINTPQIIHQTNNSRASFEFPLTTWIAKTLPSHFQGVLP
ncbi:hypothetical protein D3C79_671980 [compost metagenome]